jgi:hypothetical protein
LKPENKFRLWFVERATEYLRSHYLGLRVRFQKHADYVTSGIPDMDIAIGGITLWYEFKNLPSCKKERMLNVTPLQMGHLRELAEAGVSRGLLVGLTLGPRKGYDVALYHETIPTHASRNEFRPWTVVVNEILWEAKEAALRSHNALSQIDPTRSAIMGHLPVLADRPDNRLDDPHEDGG